MKNFLISSSGKLGVALYSGLYGILLVQALEILVPPSSQGICTGDSGNEEVDSDRNTTDLLNRFNKSCTYYYYFSSLFYISIYLFFNCDEWVQGEYKKGKTQNFTRCCTAARLTVRWCPSVRCSYSCEADREAVRKRQILLVHLWGWPWGGAHALDVGTAAKLTVRRCACVRCWYSCEADRAADVGTAATLAVRQCACVRCRVGARICEDGESLQR
jgi:hypothetical protein